MQWIKLLRVITLGFVLSIHSASAMDHNQVDSEASKNFGLNTVKKFNISEQERGKPSVVTVESKNLFMRNTTEDRKDLNHYFEIFSNDITMAKYMEGTPRPADEIIKRHKKYFSWWQTGNPFSSYLTFLNEEASRKFLQEKEKLAEPFDIFLDSLNKEFADSKKIFIGHVLLESGDDRGLQTDAEVSYVFLPFFWGKGYATEAVGNVVELVKVFHQQKITLDTRHIDTLIATARPDNPGSCRVLEKNGFSLSKEENKFGALRRLYILGL